MNSPHSPFVPGGIAIEKLAAIRSHVRAYAQADDHAAWRTLAATAAAQAGVAALYVAGWGPLAMLLGAGVTVRTFIIFHDAIHGSFFESRTWNRRLATVLQLFTLTPMKSWRDTHLAHHARFGDLDFKDLSDTIFFTRQQFDAMPPWKRGFWRVARSPFVFFALLPLLKWLGEYPFLAGNLWLWSGLALQGVLVWKLSAWAAGAWYLAMLTGVILFHLQHGIGPGYRAPAASWKFEHAALLGSTWVHIPRPFSWFTLGIEFHHVHHLHAGVPCYALARCTREAPPGAWDEVTRGAWRNCLAALRNVMWDAERREVMPFLPRP